MSRWRKLWPQASESDRLLSAIVDGPSENTPSGGSGNADEGRTFLLVSRIMHDRMFVGGDDRVLVKDMTFRVFAPSR